MFLPRCLASRAASRASTHLYGSILHRNFAIMAPKRKAAGTTTNGVSKKTKNETAPPSSSAASLREPHPFYKDAEEHGIVLREFYPHEMSNARARAYNKNELPRPMEQLNAALADTAAHRRTVQVKDAVVHWFKMDLRATDNTALFLASEKARAAGVPLVALYIVSPQDFEAHLTAPIRVDFMLRTLEVLKADLAKLDIPLYIETVEKRKMIPGRIVELMEEWGASHLYENMEYEVDELRREAKMARMLAEKGMALEVVHDTCVVPPGKLTSGSGNQYAVYSPWFRAWVAHVHDNPELLEICEPPARNPESARMKFEHLFDCKVPDAPANKKLSTEDQQKYGALWPPGEHEARKRLDLFCEERIGTYAAKRNFPGEAKTSSLSVHLASGTISARTCVRTARDRNKTKKLNAGGEGIQTWISEVAWREFYKHVLVNWPYVW